MKNSLAIRQFMEIVRGEKLPAPPAKPEGAGMRVKAVKAEFRLCQQCLTEDDLDVIHFENRMTWAVCRKCRQVHENGYITDYVMLDDGALLKKQSEVAR